MYHQHFKIIHSTQVFLKNKLEELKKIDCDILISASEQTSAIGRKGHSWDTLPNALAMSFTLRPNEIPTLTPIEIGLLVVRFIEKKFEKKILLKWPNDLLTTEGKKCGGILSQYIDTSSVIVGLGLNLGNIDSIQKNYPYPVGEIIPHIQFQELEQEKISKELYIYILKNRYLDANKLRSDFNNYCFHFNKEVLINDDGKDFIGLFMGIGANGEALIEINSSLQSFLSSSLTILN